MKEKTPKKTALKKGEKKPKSTVQEKKEKETRIVKEKKEQKVVQEKKEGVKKEFKKELAVDKAVAIKSFETILHPLITEKSIGMIETENKLVFIVNRKAGKLEVEKAVENLYKIKVDKVNILRDLNGRKRAFVKINKKFKADEIATKLGVL